MSGSLRIEHAKHVIVEGQDEIRVFGSMLKYLNIPDMQVHEIGGYSKLRQFLKTFRALPEFALVRSLAIVVDADSNSINRARGIRDALSAVAMPIPSAPLVVASDDNLKVIYLIVPHGHETGMIEDVCLGSVSADPAMECIEDYFECVRRRGLPGPRDVRISKARVHAFLASRERPELRLGEAAEVGVWPFDTDAFQPLKDLLRML